MAGQGATKQPQPWPRDYAIHASMYGGPPPGATSLATDAPAPRSAYSARVFRFLSRLVYASFAGKKVKKLSHLTRGRYVGLSEERHGWMWQDLRKDDLLDPGEGKRAKSSDRAKNEDNDKSTSEAEADDFFHYRKLDSSEVLTRTFTTRGSIGELAN